MKTLGIIARPGEPMPFGMQSYYFDDMIRYVYELPVRLEIFSPMDWTKGSGQVLSHYFDGRHWQTHMIDLPRVIYNRFTAREAGEQELYETLAGFLQQRDHHFYVPLAMERLLKDKARFQHFLTGNQLPSLNHIDRQKLSNDYIHELLLTHQAIYLKPRKGSGGKGIAVLHRQDGQMILTTSEDVSVMNSSEVANDLVASFPEEEYVLQPQALTKHFEGACYDIRVMIQNNGFNEYEASAVSVRSGQKGQWVSNLHAGGAGVAIELMEKHFQKEFGRSLEEIDTEVKRLAGKCVNALRRTYGNFAELALDLLYTADQGVIILEGNSKPSRWVFLQIADQLPSESALHHRYCALRQKTVVYPLVYRSNLEL